MHRIQINKANLSDNFKLKDKKGSNKRVYGEFQLEFDLKKIFDDI